MLHNTVKHSLPKNSRKALPYKGFLVFSSLSGPCLVGFLNLVSQVQFLQGSLIFIEGCLASTSLFEGLLTRDSSYSLGAFWVQNSPKFPHFYPFSETNKKGFKGPYPLEILDFYVEPGSGLEPPTC